MKKDLKAGDRVSWNSEAGRVSGNVVRIHVQNVGHKRAALRKLPGARSRRGGG